MAVRNVKERCEAVMTCAGGRRGTRPKQCTEEATEVRDGRRVCWSHKRSLSVRFYVDAAVPLETLLKIKTTLEHIHRRQKVRLLRAELARRQRRDKHKVCLICANLPWRRRKPSCSGCGMPHRYESESAMRPRIT